MHRSRNSRRVAICFVAIVAIPLSALARDPDESSSSVSTRGAKREGGETGSHPLDKAIDYAESMLERMDSIQGYSALLLKRERIGGKLLDHEYAEIKVRHKPFSVYMRFVKPTKLKGREVMFVEGENKGKLLAHEPAFDRFGTVLLSPTGRVAMRDQRYPITEIGFKNLAQQLLERGRLEKRRGADCHVRFRQGAKINDRAATVLEIERSRRTADDEFFRITVYIDDERKIPVRYEAYGWPTEGGEATLLEEYTYLNIKLNPGLDDADFNIKNPSYSFPPLNVLANPKRLFQR